MFASLSAFVGDTFFAGLALIALGVVGYLVGLVVRDRIARSRYYRHRQRHRIRRQFWGYD